jgi:hypothetical protein
MLDPVVATPAPPRNRRLKRKAGVLYALTSPLGLVAGTFAAVEPAVVTVPVVAARLRP